MVHEHGSLLAAARLSFASSWARWRTGTVAWGTKALGGIGERPNCSASSLKLATAKSLNISWKFYFAVLWLQQDSLNGVRYKLSAEVIYERSLQGSFNLDHNNGRITQKNLFFLFLFFHFILWQADLPGVAFRSFVSCPLKPVLCGAGACLAPHTLALSLPWGVSVSPPFPAKRRGSWLVWPQLFHIPLRSLQGGAYIKNPWLFHTAGAFHVLLPEGKIASFHCSPVGLHLGGLFAACLQRWGWE